MQIDAAERAAKTWAPSLEQEAGLVAAFNLSIVSGPVTDVVDLSPGALAVVCAGEANEGIVEADLLVRPKS